MKSLGLGRIALNSCAVAALLAGCGALRQAQDDMQLPIGAPRSVLGDGGATHQVPYTSFYQVVHRFSVRGRAPSSLPDASLLDVKGTLYGTTLGTAGGQRECGTAFSTSTTGVTKRLYRFRGPDGCRPGATLIDVKGVLYGTTPGGGKYGDGVVFSLTTSGAETVLYSFKGTPDGDQPWGGLVDLKGTLYGTTAAGGNPACHTLFFHGCGTVYSITTSGAESIVHKFDVGKKLDGIRPLATLIAINGTLYGTTVAGGLSWGTVFSVTPTGSERVLYSFAGGTDGNYPYAPLLDVGGTLYGTTALGGSSSNGTVYSVTRSGSESVLYSFAGGSDGSSPTGLIDVNGEFYGTTANGGGYSGCNDGSGIDCGTIYSLTPGGSEQVLHRFAGGSDGGNPNAALLNVNGTLYGTTLNGGGKGCRGGCGTVFSLTP